MPKGVASSDSPGLAAAADNGKGASRWRELHPQSRRRWPRLTSGDGSGAHASSTPKRGGDDGARPPVPTRRPALPAPARQACSQ